MWVLGVNCKLHDSSAALVDGEGRIWAMAEEERFTRVRYAEGTFPAHTARFCLDTAGITWRDIDVVAMGWDMPRFRKWHGSERQEMYAALFGPEAASCKDPEPVFDEHHLAHALSAFHASGFDKAGVLVVDGSGEFASASIYAGDHASGLILKRRRPRGYSLGAMYEATSRLPGFGQHGAGKTMGLAPYGMESDSVVLPMGDMLGDDEWKDKLPLVLAPDAALRDARRPLGGLPHPPLRRRDPAHRAAERRPRGHPPRAGGGHRGRRRTDLPEHRAGLPRARKPPGRARQVVAASDTEQ
jgi:carbamoyltransferase